MSRNEAAWTTWFLRREEKARGRIRLRRYGIRYRLLTIPGYTLTASISTGTRPAVTAKKLRTLPDRGDRRHGNLDKRAGKRWRGSRDPLARDVFRHSFFFSCGFTASCLPRSWFHPELRFASSPASQVLLSEPWLVCGFILLQ